MSAVDEKETGKVVVSDEELEIWLEEIDPEFRQWLEKNDTSYKSISRYMCLKESTGPKDFISSHYFYPDLFLGAQNAGINAMGLFPASMNFYEKYDPLWYKKRMK